MGLLNDLLTVRGDITLFGDSELYQSLEYGKLRDDIYELRQRLLHCYGPEMEELLDEYTETVESKEDFIAEHYFAQGFLAAQK